MSGRDEQLSERGDAEPLNWRRCRCYDLCVSGSTHNIEAVARDICCKALSRVGISGPQLAADVDRYWHCVAAQLESGQIDESGNSLVPYDFDTHTEAYRDWRRRHLDYEPPPMKRYHDQTPHLG